MSNKKRGESDFSSKKMGLISRSPTLLKSNLCNLGERQSAPQSPPGGKITQNIIIDNLYK